MRFYIKHGKGNMKTTFYGGLLGALFALTVFVAGAIGWVWNILKLIDADMVLSGLIIVRVVGIFVPPVGAIVGYF